MTNTNMFQKSCKSCNVKIRHKPIIERVIKGTLGSITGFFSGALIATLAAPGPGTFFGALGGAGTGLSAADKSPDYCGLCCERCNKKKQNCPCDFTVYYDYDAHYEEY